MATAWLLFYRFFRNSDFFFEIYESLTYYLTNTLLVCSKFVLEIFGYEIEIFGKIIKIKDGFGILLNRGCLGRNLLGLYVGLLAAYPGSIRHKLWYIPAGVVAIIFLNMIRISSLVVIAECCPDKLAINHDIIFKYSIYIIVLIMWVVWINKFSKINR